MSPMRKGTGGVRCTICGARASADGKGSPIVLHHADSCPERELRPPIYLVIRDTGRAEVVFASHDEIERDRVLVDLRASVAPHSGVSYHDDLITLDDLTFAAFYLDEAASG